MALLARHQGRPGHTDRPGMGGRHPRLSDAHEHHRRRRRSGRHVLAVRHGLSANGNDHVHIMVQLAADDGWINPYRDRINAQRSCRRMEKTRPELVGSHAPIPARASAGSTGNGVNGRMEGAERVRRRRGMGCVGRQSEEPARHGGRRLHDAAPVCRPDRGGVRQASRSEDEFIRRVRREGFSIDPAAQGNRQRLVHRPRPGGRLQDHVA